MQESIFELTFEYFLLVIRTYVYNIDLFLHFLLLNTRFVRFVKF